MELGGERALQHLNRRLLVFVLERGERDAQESVVACEHKLSIVLSLRFGLQINKSVTEVEQWTLELGDRTREEGPSAWVGFGVFVPHVLITVEDTKNLSRGDPGLSHEDADRVARRLGFVV